MSQVTFGTYGTMFYVSDMKKTSAFYKENLGLTPDYESDDWTQFNVGDGTFLCLHGIRPGTKPLTEGGILIAKVKGLKALTEQLKAKGVEFVKEMHEVSPGAYSSDFKDPHGNVVSLYEGASY